FGLSHDLPRLAGVEWMIRGVVIHGVTIGGIVSLAGRAEVRGTWRDILPDHLDAQQLRAVRCIQGKAKTDQVGADQGRSRGDTLAVVVPFDLDGLEETLEAGKLLCRAPDPVRHLRQRFDYAQARSHSPVEVG